MTTRVDRKQLEAGKWYQVRQGSVLIPMELEAWVSSAEVSMHTRSGSPRRVSILNIVDGWDPHKGELFELPKTGEATPAGACHCPGCRLCQSSSTLGTKEPAKLPELTLEPGTVAHDVLMAFFGMTSIGGRGITDAKLMIALSHHTGGSVRGRRADLVKHGFVEATGVYGRTQAGRPTQQWAITVAGCEAWAGVCEAVGA